MSNRRLSQVASSDDEDSTPPPRNSNGDENNIQRRRKRLWLPDEDEEEKVMQEENLSERNKEKEKSEEPEPQAASENDEQEDVEAQPLGEVVRVSGKGRGKRDHYASFEYDGLQYQLEDSVILAPEQGNLKPYVAIIKDISQTRAGAVMVTGQWLYRPDEAEKKGGGHWESDDTRELFYSFHRDEVPAESVLHKCVVHFIPRNKQIPLCKQHPGFIVQKVYDIEKRRLLKLTDKDHEDNKQHEVNLLVQKTLARLGDPPDVEPEGADLDHEDQIKNKRLLRKRNVPPLGVAREDEGLSRSLSLKVETPGRIYDGASEYYTIMSNFKLLTGETQRDKWLEKLLQSIQYICTPEGSKQDKKELRENKNAGSEDHGNESYDKSTNHDAPFGWPDVAAPAVAALEKAAHEFSADFQKYNQKMRQLTFNLKGSAVLARRLLSSELEPDQIVNMLPNELKVGLTAEEIASREPEESGRVQMTDARCKRCMEKQVGLIDIIQTGHGDRYQVLKLASYVTSSEKYIKMGKSQNGSAAAAQPHVCTTLREESRGKKQGHVNTKVMCKLDHLKNLAVWAATEAFVPSLGAVYGERLAATTEALGIRGDPSLFVCERCESILQPGHNCTVRIEKNKSKMRRKRKKSNPTLQNNVVYRCHFCSHRNLMRGTPKGYVKEISPPKAKPPSKFQPTKLAVEKHAGSAKPTTGILTANQADAIDLPTADGQNVEASNPASPLPTTGVSLLDSKRRKRNRSSAKKVVEHETISTEASAEKSIQSSNKRRKKSWTSLKDIAQGSEHDAGKKKFTNLIIPFFI